ncbi:hypothetical protein BC940DRAFT_316211 [Gongronella butleri]|nr:hypothetical protein BC940DRAFT_316211 [Gongronella butleri]
MVVCASDTWLTAVGSVLAAPAVELSHLFNKADVLVAIQYSQCLGKDCLYQNVADFNPLQAVCYVACYFVACGSPAGDPTNSNAGGSMSGNNPTTGDSVANPGAEGGVGGTGSGEGESKRPYK